MRLEIYLKSPKFLDGRNLQLNTSITTYWYLSGKLLIAFFTSFNVIASSTNHLSSCLQYQQLLGAPHLILQVFAF